MFKTAIVVSLACALVSGIGIAPATAQTSAQAPLGTPPVSPYAGAQIGRHTVYTADMEKSIAFWVEGLGYTMRGQPMELGGAVIEKSFALKPGGKMRFVVLQPGDSGGLLVGLMSSVGTPFKALKRDPEGAPLAGETFVLVRVADVTATFTKLRAMGIAVNTEPMLIPSGTIEGSVIAPEGNRMVIQQAQPSK
jgi:predicted enzyme related to lactoylglutathione lyase